MKHCSICNELNKKEEYNRLQGIFKNSNVVNAILYRNDHFSIIPSIGGLKTGHSLIVPNNHCNSIFSKTKHNHILLRTLKAAWDKLSDKNNLLFCFEHGANSELEVNLCSTTHAHLHLIPLSKESTVEIDNKLNYQNEFETYESVLDFADLSTIVKQHNEYLCFFTFDGNSVNNFSIKNAKGIESQYMRKIIGQYFGNKNWDWKKNEDNSLTYKTIEQFDFVINE